MCLIFDRSAEPSFLDCRVKYRKCQTPHYDSIVFEQSGSQQSTSDGLQSTSDCPPIPADVGTQTHEPDVATGNQEPENEHMMEYEYQCLLQKDSISSIHLCYT